MRKSILLISCLLLASAFAAADEWNKTFKVGGNPDLWVNAQDGSVELTSWDQKEIQVRVETEGWKIAENEVRIHDRQHENRVEIELRIPSTRFFRMGGYRSVRMYVKVPRESRLDINTADGSISGTDLRGDLRFRSGDGSIRGADLRGELRFNTGDGSIEINNAEGRLSADTGDGSVRVSGRFDAIKVRTGDGSIRLQAERGSKVKSAWSFSTGDGNVELRLPGDLEAELDARTGDGGINIEFPVTVSGSLRGHEMRGKINGGGPPLEIRTGDGSIRVSRL